MRHWSLLLTGLFASASVVVTTQVKAQKPVQVQKRSSINSDLYTKVLTTAYIATNNCYEYGLVNECARLNRIQSTLIQYCGSGDKIACNLMADVYSMELQAKGRQIIKNAI
ncbi:MAG: hypothetical protein WBA41_05775 [Rivularia sp. (in: cyanobacteria)]